MPRSLNSRQSLLMLATCAAAVLIPACSNGDLPDPGNGDLPDPGTLAVAVTPTSMNVAQGRIGSATLSVTRGGAFTGVVALSASGAPAGVSLAFNPATVAAGSTSSTVQATISSSLATGSYPVTITAAGTGVNTATATLTVMVVASTDRLLHPVTESGRADGRRGRGGGDLGHHDCARRAVHRAGRVDGDRCPARRYRVSRSAGRRRHSNPQCPVDGGRDEWHL